jgi:hypothetical protein
MGVLPLGRWYRMGKLWQDEQTRKRQMAIAR